MFGVLETYLVASALLAAIALLNVVDPGGATPGVALYDAGLVGAVAFGYAFWLRLPRGCASGLVHERAVALR